MSNLNLKSKNSKFILVLLFIIVGTVLIYIFKNAQLTSQYKDFKIINYQLQSKNPSTSLRTSYKLLVADTPDKWEKGLMFFRKLDGVDGMIFLFPDKQYREFWNKNTLMNLNLIWIDGNQIVGTSDLPSIEKSKDIVVVSSPRPVDKVIEIPK